MLDFIWFYHYFRFIIICLTLFNHFWGGLKPIPIRSMYGTFTTIYPINGSNVGTYTIHGAYGIKKIQYIYIRYIYINHCPSATFFRSVFPRAPCVRALAPWRRMRRPLSRTRRCWRMRCTPCGWVAVGGCRGLECSNLRACFWGYVFEGLFMETGILG